jgi:uncharacterized protein (TIGR00730 family)
VNSGTIKRIAVYCGSSYGAQEIYKTSALALGQELARRGIEVVYGGANVGLMGAVADGALQAGGRVIGVLPNFLQNRELAHPYLSELHLVETMHERKMMMNDLSDGVIALPGGFGTLEELFEMLTWGQLGLHQKPVALLNVDRFYDTLLEFLTTMTNDGFLKAENRSMLLVGVSPQEVLENMSNYQPPKVEKWLSPEIV